MNAAFLLRELEQRGVRFEAEGDRLLYRAPAGVLTPELLNQIKACKSELLALLVSVAPPALDGARDLAAAWRGAVRELGDLAGHPELPFKSGHVVSPGAANWGIFITKASVPDLCLVVVALRELIASMSYQGDAE